MKIQKPARPKAHVGAEVHLREAPAPAEGACRCRSAPTGSASAAEGAYKAVRASASTMNLVESASQLSSFFIKSADLL